MTRTAYIARYLHDTTTGATITFADFMPPADVKDKLIAHRMHQVVQSASSLLDPALSEKVKTAFIRFRDSL
jgi:hypothetical protein